MLSDVQRFIVRTPFYDYNGIRVMLLNYRDRGERISMKQSTPRFNAGEIMERESTGRRPQALSRFMSCN